MSPHISWRVGGVSWTLGGGGWCPWLWSCPHPWASPRTAKPTKEETISLIRRSKSLRAGITSRNPSVFYKTALHWRRTRVVFIWSATSAKTLNEATCHYQQYCNWFRYKEHVFLNHKFVTRCSIVYIMCIFATTLNQKNKRHNLTCWDRDHIFTFLEPLDCKGYHLSVFSIMRYFAWNSKL